MNNTPIKQIAWAKFLKFYSEQNSGRLTRVGVFDNGTDYWLEDGLPLSGVDFDGHGESVSIEIMLGENMTHVIRDVQKVKVSFSFEGSSDGMDITNSEGKTTILRFEG